MATQKTEQERYKKKCVSKKKKQQQQQKPKQFSRFPFNKFSFPDVSH